MKILMTLTMLLSACASAPKCQTQGNATAVYTSVKSCEVRIRRIEIGSKLQAPESLRNSDQFTQELDWVDSTYENGQIVTGHFVVMQKKIGQTNEH